MVEDDFALCGTCWRDTPFLGQTVCDACGVHLPGQIDAGETLICDSCLQHPPPWRQGRAALHYRDTARRLVLGLKHGDRHDIVRPAAQWMARAAAQMSLPETALVVPIPLNWRRLLKRRYNQSALLAQNVSAELNLAYSADLLVRSNSTPSLDGKTRSERQDILANAITANPRRKSQIFGRSVLIVDDVLTTGATLSAATQACLDAGADHVNVLVLARVAKDP